MTGAIATTEAALPSAQSKRTLVRNALVLQLKLFVSGWLHFLLGPATLVAMCLDLLWTSDRQSSRFYRVLRWGHRAETALGLFASLGEDEEAVTPGRPVQASAGNSSPS